MDSNPFVMDMQEMETFTLILSKVICLMSSGTMNYIKELEKFLL